MYYQTEHFVSLGVATSTVLAREDYTMKRLILSGEKHFSIQSLMGGSVK